MALTLYLQRKILFMHLRRWICTIIILLISFQEAMAQCSICTKTAQQLGEGPASALNNAIVYLMITPLLLMGFVGYRWWKREQQVLESEKNN
jgi:hypothetical protein